MAGPAHDVKRLAAEYYACTQKPLGVTGEVAEFEAAERLGLTLEAARTEGYDATRTIAGSTQRVQIKGRRVLSRSGRVPTINLEKDFDIVILVLLDEHYDAIEMWEAGRTEIAKRLLTPGSKSRNERGSMGISQFKSIATKVWSRD